MNNAKKTQNVSQEDWKIYQAYIESLSTEQLIDNIVGECPSVADIVNLKKKEK
tara:strand:- start:1291 stop:1449 length:159 start_codon:yes stop_codon:yes gene_type:complete